MSKIPWSDGFQLHQTLLERTAGNTKVGDSAKHIGEDRDYRDFHLKTQDPSQPASHLRLNPQTVQIAREHKALSVLFGR